MLLLPQRPVYLTGLRTGPFAKAVFADSLAGLFNAAPLLMATKPWHYASWRLVIIIIGFQVSCIGVWSTWVILPGTLCFRVVPI